MRKLQNVVCLGMMVCLSLLGCSGGKKSDCVTTASTQPFRQYGAIGALGLPGLTFDIAINNGHIFQNYIVYSSRTTNWVFIDRADRQGVDEQNFNAAPESTIIYPPGNPGDLPYPREPFALAVASDGSLFVGVISKDPTTVPNTVEKFDTSVITTPAKLPWDPLRANPGLAFNFTQPVGFPVKTVGDQTVINPDFVAPKYSIAVDKKGDVYVEDADGPGSTIYQVRKFRGASAVLDTSFGDGGKISVGDFGKIAVDGDGNLYVTYTNDGIPLNTPGRGGVRRFSPRGVPDTAFIDRVSALRLASANARDEVRDVEILETGGVRRIYVLEYRRVGDAEQSLIHVLTQDGERLYSLEPQLNRNGTVKGVDTRDIAVADEDNIYLNTAFDSFYPDSGGWARYQPSTASRATALDANPCVRP